jgi:hypothetical protein
MPLLAALSVCETLDIYMKDLFGEGSEERSVLKWINDVHF